LKIQYIFALVVIVVITIFGTGCTSQQSAIPDGATLVIVGQVDTEIGWLEEDVRAMDTIQVEAKNKKGEMDTDTGVKVADLLNLAGVKAKATNVVFVAADGTTAEISLADIQTCEECILSFRQNGGFSLIAPNLSKDAKLRGVVKFEVK
jgi:hypothetical protein